jgi:tetratricopeptide (TPR) repeat protein
MKTLKITLLSTILLFGAAYISAQPLSKEYKTEVIQTLSELMNDHYIFPDVAKKTEAHLLNQLKEGHFKSYETNEAFAAALTVSVQEVNKDKHMRIRAEKPYQAPANTPERQIEEKLNGIDQYRKYNAGFKTVEVLEGNVGYLDIRGFAPQFYGKDFADAYMKLIAQCDAVIIDLSKNGGGDPEMVQYLCSYFMEGGMHLNDLYFREGERTIEFWTLEKVDGAKMIDVPLFVITGEKTFSGAEEFSYNMQTQKRATLVGQTTGGGANPGGSMRINDELTVFIPRGMAINPITKTNWEGVGVIPEIKTEVSETLDKTLELAQVAAKDYKAKKREENSSLLNELNALLERHEEGASEEPISKSLTTCIDANLLTEGDINMMGYFYLMDLGKPISAEVIFKQNTLLFPNSPNVYDSYAESLMMKGDLEASQKWYKKAVEIAVKTNDRNVEFYQKNLKALEDEMKK